MSPLTDGTSWWMATSPETELAPLDRDLEVDVCVVGAGITGLLTAWELTQSGLSVAVLERGRVAGSVTGFTTAKLTSQHGLKYSHLEHHQGLEAARAYGAANERALRHILELAEKLDIDAQVEMRDAYVYATLAESVPHVRAEAKAAARAGLPGARFVEEVPLPFPTRGAVVFSEQAQIHPRTLLLGLTTALAERGCEIYEQTQVVELEPGDPCVITTTAGPKVRARHVVLATLLPSPIGRELARRLYCHQGYAVAAPVQGDPLAGGMFINADRPMRSLRTMPAGSGADRVLQVGGSAWVDEPASGNEPWDDLDAWAVATFGSSPATHRWSTQDYSTSDGVPLIGELPGAHGVHVATGFGGWGLTTAAVAAELIAASIRGEDAAWHNMFDPGRSMPDADTRIVAGHRTGLPFDPEMALDALPPGAALVVQRDGEEVAAHRDEQGQLHCVSAVCTHLRGIVLWDHDAGEWHCPCHGSRFTPDGAVTAGPAREPLPPR